MIDYLGLLRLDGGAVDGERLRSLVGDSPHELCCEGPIGFVARRLPPSLDIDGSPLVQMNEGAFFVGQARLDDRRFAEALALGDDRTRLDDAGLVFRALCRWGAEALSLFHGDWSFAFWKRSEGELLLARDAWGMSSLHYGYRPGRLLAFSNHLPLLFPLEGLARGPDRSCLVSLAALRPSLDPGQTAWEGIRRIPAGKALRWSEGKSRILDHGPWDEEAPVSLSDEDCLREGAELLEKAVRRRLPEEGAVGLSLSSGFDSTSVLALAAPALARQGRRLVAMTLAPRQETLSREERRRRGDESRAAAALCQRFENVDHHVIRSPHVSMLGAAFEALDFTGEPAIRVAHWHGRSLMAGVMKEAGVRTLLVGGLGNATLSWGGANSWLEVWQHGGPAFCLGDFVRCLASPLHRRPALRSLKNEIGGRGREGGMGPADLSLLSEAGRARFAELGCEEAWREVLASSAAVLRRALIRRAMTVGSALSLGWAHCWQGCARDPLADEDFVRFCLRLPFEQSFRFGRGRFLARRLVPRLLGDPDWRRQPGGIACGDLRERLVDDVDEIDEALRRFEGNEAVAELFSMDALRAVSRRLRNEPASLQEKEPGSFLLSLQIAEFLSRF